MSKTPYFVLSQQVNKLYEKQFDLKDVKSINNHCEFIRSFIEANGWSVEDYIAKLALPSTNLN